MITAAPQQPVFRFAPSPNGRLHLGHALSAILNHDMAAATGGRFLLRIEDIDRTRCTPEFEAAILTDLHWLGLSWERPVRRQSEHLALYGQALERLKALDLVYPAFLTRGEIREIVAAFEADGRRWPRDPDGGPHYPGAEREVSPAERRAAIGSGQPFALRLNMNRAIAAAGVKLFWTETGDGETARVAADPAAWGDIVLSRAGEPSSYHLAVTVDDAAQGVTHVVRGRDLYPATAVHRLLQTLLGLPEPVYHHHRLVMGPDGRKLSKRFGDQALSALREAGQTPDDIRKTIMRAD